MGYTSTLEQIDKVTGEVIEGFVAVVQPKRKNAFREGWIAMAQDALNMLAEINRVEDFRVLMKLLARLDFDNLIQINQAEISKELKIDKSNVNKSIKRLIQIGVLIEGPKVGIHKTYRLNPWFGWKGSAKTHQEAVRAVMKERMKAAGIKAVIDGGQT